ncbi:hypothetical protein DFR49_2304 [Hephaestia caeni]|uniref:Uncharacterized protein n=1 Tax=Hephaestia caeni TaxID=645617 RepID=A0A397P599_9SPHN|nr:hypothetical protein [Hephaestia caeni]RIA44068.1 hypothetical protein DFR49_2304 [Hephaestia caeni]
MGVVALRLPRASAPRRLVADDVAHRGYRPVYSVGCRCPGCASGAWFVGRVSAECARCGTALPLGPDQHSSEERFQ